MCSRKIHSGRIILRQNSCLATPVHSVISYRFRGFQRFLGAYGIHRPVDSVDEWLELFRRYKGDAELLLANRRAESAWFNAGLAIECCLKAAIMSKEGLNRWPERATAPELWSHDLVFLFRRLGIDPLGFDPQNELAPALKLVLDWRREHGYAIGKFPMKYAKDMNEAAFGSPGVIEWIAGLYRLNI